MAALRNKVLGSRGMSGDGEGEDAYCHAWCSMAAPAQQAAGYGERVGAKGYDSERRL